MPKKTPMSHDRARGLVLAALGLPETTLDWKDCTPPGQPPVGYAGALTRARRQGEVFRVSVWEDAHAALEQPHDRYLEVHADGQVEALPTSAQDRQNAARRTGKPRGRPPTVPEGLERNPRISFTPHQRSTLRSSGSQRSGA